MYSQNLETRTGTLAKLVPQFEPGSILTASELMNERRTNPELRDEWFYTSDFGLYKTEDNKPVIYLGSENNPIFANLEEATKQLVDAGNYFVPEKDVAPAIKSASRFDIEELKLKVHNSEFSYLEINTADYKRLNPEQRRLAEAVYGQGKNFTDNMERLANKGISTTRIYTLNPDYVKKETTNGKTVARAGWLDIFLYSSGFEADGRDVYGSGALRGVPKETIRANFK